MPNPRNMVLDSILECDNALRKPEADDRSVRVHLSTGEVVTAEYLIGCDGDSAVRKAVGFALRGETLATESASVADVEVEGLDHTHWHVWPFAKGGSIALPAIHVTGSETLVSA